MDLSKEMKSENTGIMECSPERPNLCYFAAEIPVNGSLEVHQNFPVEYGFAIFGICLLLCFILNRK